MYLEEYTNEQLQAIYGEFGLTEESLGSQVLELKKWLGDQPHLPKVEDDDILKNFILRCKNDLTRTKKTLELYYTTKAKVTEVFTNRDVCSAEFKKCITLSNYICMPKLTPEGYRVGVLRMGKLDDKLPSPTEYVKTLLTITLITMKLDSRCAKNIIISDCSGISLPFVTLMLMSLKRILSLSSKVFPFRYHKIYLVNVTPAINPIIILAKKIANKEVGQRIKIWKKKPKDLIQVISKECLPIDYGGVERSIETLSSLWIDELKNYNKWVQLEEQDVADLKLKKSDRASKKLSNTEVEIAFRDLNID